VHARIATFEDVEPERVEQEAKAIRSMIEGEARRPEGLEDVKGVLLLLDRENGRSMAITVFGSEEGMQRGDAALNAMNPEQGEGRRSSVQFYEVPLNYTG